MYHRASGAVELSALRFLSRDCGDGGMTWAMAVGLAKLLGHRPEYPRLRVLELGAGPGLVALLLAARGHEVVATDGADCVLANLRKNTAEQSRISVRRLRWHVDDDLRHSLGAFDLLVGADLVHDATQCDALRAVLRAVRGASEVLLMERDRLGQGRRCAELLRGDGLDLELEPASATSATSATGDVIVDGQRNPPHLMSEMASALLIRLALPDPREKGRMANFEDRETLEVLCARLRTASTPVQRAVLEALPHVAAPCSEPALGAVRAALKASLLDLRCTVLGHMSKERDTSVQETSEGTPADAGVPEVSSGACAVRQPESPTILRECMDAFAFWGASGKKECAARKECAGSDRAEWEDGATWAGDDLLRSLVAEVKAISATRVGKDVSGNNSCPFLPLSRLSLVVKTAECRRKSFCSQSLASRTTQL
ncbi:unnamed protein product [Symbiodinium microadriaticum]|nr:unnamed protein product [Symbiodinium sp. KB8]CAE7481273.1 unnamed protein product [Symbiodinium microadriaticum]